MTKAEFGKFVMALKTYYPRENLLPNNQAIELWFNQLADLDYTAAELALNKWVSTSKWSPSIADIREAALDIKVGAAPDWGEAWESVIHAIRYFGTWQEREAMESFDEITRKVVRQMGFRDLCMSENIVADRANFRMIYERAVERDRQDAQLPLQLRQLMSDYRIGQLEKGADVSGYLDESDE